MVQTDIVPLTQMVLQSYADRAAAKSITVLPDYTVPAMIITIDTQAMMQVLDNLVSNAVKYTPQGGTVTVSIYQSEYQSQKQCRLTVQDTGQGISKSEQYLLFGKFARLSSRPTGGEPSNGLGLSIVKRLVEAMKGKVWCESEQGQGARFTVEFGLACVD